MSTELTSDEVLRALLQVPTNGTVSFRNLDIRVRKLFPSAMVTEDSNGELVICTNLALQGDGYVVTLQEMKEATRLQGS